MSRRTFVGLFVLMALGCSREGGTARKGPSGSKKLVIAVIPKGTTYEFWKSVHAGANRAGKELGVEILWKGPLNESDREAQVNVVQDFITRRVDGICLAPLDSQALAAAVKEAKVEGIPTVIYDSGLDDGSLAISTVATNNYAGGALAARHMGTLLGGKGRIIVLRYTPGSQSSELRENGFLKTTRQEFPSISIVSDGEYAGANAEMALDEAQVLLAKFGDSLDGVFTPCEHVTAGMLRALEERDLAGKVKFVGFDVSPRLLQALRDHKIHGLVLQDPVGMGDLAVRTMAAYLRGEKVPRAVDTGETLATPENMDQAEVRARLQPEQFGGPGPSP